MDLGLNPASLVEDPENLPGKNTIHNIPWTILQALQCLQYAPSAAGRQTSPHLNLLQETMGKDRLLKGRALGSPHFYDDWRDP